MWVATAKFVLLLFPAALGVAAIWCTQLSIYTLPFRSARLQFASALLLTWWDAARAVWLYWMGLVRLVAVVAGWLVVLGGFLVRTVVAAVRHLAMMPFTMSGRIAERYFQPGVPWVATIALVVWCLLEAALLSLVLHVPVTEIFVDLSQTPAVARFTGPVLFMVIFPLVLGSFACAQALVDAVRSRQPNYLGQMLGVEVCVAYIEVVLQ